MKRNRVRRTLLSWFPRSVRHHLYRQHICLDTSLPEGLTFKIAETKEELEAAFQLLHDSYVEQGFMKPSPSGMRITKYHALPTTTTLIAVMNEKVIATVSVIGDNPLGCPIESICDISSYRQGGKRVAEISSLAIHHGFRDCGDKILFPLTKFLWQYCYYYLCLDYMVVVVHPKHADLYEGILLFDRITPTPLQECSLVNGNPAVSLVIDLRNAWQKWYDLYNHRPEGQNLYRYFSEVKIKAFQFPDRTFFKVFDPVITPELFDHFFNRVTPLLSTLTDHERTLLQLMYPYDGYQNLLRENTSLIAFSRRKERRFQVECTGWTYPTQSLSLMGVRMKDVSLGGFRAHIKGEIMPGQPLQFLVHVGRNETVNLRAYPVRKDPNGHYGFQVIESSMNWQGFIQYLEKDHSNGFSEQIKATYPCQNLAQNLSLAISGRFQ